MKESMTHDMLLGLPRRIFITTDLIAYAVVIPATAVVSFAIIGLELGKAPLFFSIVAGATAAAAIITLTSYRKLFAPIIRCFRAVLESREVSKEEWNAARIIFFQLPRKRSIEAFVTWCVLMPTAIALIWWLFRPGPRVIILMITILFIDACSMASLYYIAIEAITRRVARTGIFSRAGEAKDVTSTKMSSSLALLITALVGVICSFMVMIAFELSHRMAGQELSQTMSHTAMLLRDRIELILPGPDEPDFQERLSAAARKAAEEIRSQGHYGVAIRSDGVVIASPDQAVISRRADEFPWGKPLLAMGEGCYSFQNEKGGRMNACVAASAPAGFKTAYIVDYDQVESGGWRIAIFMLSFAAAALALVGFGIYRLTAFRLAPLNDCEAVILETGRGDLSREVISYSTDEPGTILTAMAGFLETLRRIISRIKETAENLASASLEMTATAETFSENAQRQASTAEQVTATAEEVSAGVEAVATDTLKQYAGINLLLSQIKDLDKSISETAMMIREADEISSDISRKAREGGQSLADMNNAMNMITRSSEEMTGIVKIINDISEQINLLSLNAAIEAARAGEAGRGFAVVADEISKLADQTASSIKDIDRLIKANTEQIQRGQSYIATATRVIGAIIEGVATITSRMGTLSENIKRQVTIKETVTSEADAAQVLSDQIRLATDEQKRSMDEIVKSITHINELTQSIAAGSEEMLANLKGIEKMAEELRESISYFRAE